MVELEKIKQSNPSLRVYDAIYLVVTPSKATCDSFQLVHEHEMNEKGMKEFDLSDFVDECPEEDDESMEVEQNRRTMQRQDEEKSSWKQVITYLDPDSVYHRKDGAHLVMKDTEDPPQKKIKQIP